MRSLIRMSEMIHVFVTMIPERFGPVDTGSSSLPNKSVAAIRTKAVRARTQWQSYFIKNFSLFTSSIFSPISIYVVIAAAVVIIVLKHKLEKD